MSSGKGMTWRSKWRPAFSLNNRPTELMHNHVGPGSVVYAGFSKKAPTLHLFRCVAVSTPRRLRIELKPFLVGSFSPESKAGTGGCSIRGCPGDAVRMNKDETAAYCERCAERTTQVVPCPWTSTSLCSHRLRLAGVPYGRSCATCGAFEVAS